MILLETLPGEWPTAAIGLGVVFAVAVTGVIGLGWWVLRADRINRRFESEPPLAQPLHEAVEAASGRAARESAAARASEARGPLSEEPRA